MIRPVEMQMLVQRTEGVAHIQHLDNTRNIQQNAILAAQVDKNVKQNSDTVIQKDSVEINEHKYDAKEKGNTQYSGNDGKHHKKKEHDEKEDLTKKAESARINFDIKV